MEHLLHTCPLMMEENLKVAKEAGITVNEYLVPWEQLAGHKSFHRFVSLRAKSLHLELEVMNRNLIDADDITRRLWKTHIGSVLEMRSLTARLRVHPKNNWFRVGEGEVPLGGNAACRSRGQLTVSRDADFWSITHGWHNGEMDLPEQEWMRSTTQVDTGGTLAPTSEGSSGYTENLE